jgi:hypothetical protein
MHDPEIRLEVVLDDLADRRVRRLRAGSGDREVGGERPSLPLDPKGR